MYTRETPDEYEPPGFQRGCEQDVAWFTDEPISVKPGKVSTPFHNVSVTIRAQPSPENLKARVLKRRLEGDPHPPTGPLLKNATRKGVAHTKSVGKNNATDDPHQNTEIDVGPSDGNSIRVTRDVVIRDTQDEMDTDESPHHPRSSYILTGTETSCTKTRDSHPVPFSNNHHHNVSSRLRKRRKISKAETLRK